MEEENSQLLFISVFLDNYFNITITNFAIGKYNETCLNRAHSGSTFVFGINRCLVYTGYINKYFLHLDFI
jgi:hypothetical protein